MNDIAGIPYVEAEFDKKGQLLSQVAIPQGVTDLVVVDGDAQTNPSVAGRVRTVIRRGLLVPG